MSTIHYRQCSTLCPSSPSICDDQLLIDEGTVILGESGSSDYKRVWPLYSY